MKKHKVTIVPAQAADPRRYSDPSLEKVLKAMYAQLKRDKVIREEATFEEFVEELIIETRKRVAETPNIQDIDANLSNE